MWFNLNTPIKENEKKIKSLQGKYLKYRKL
jgi:hypothetical protein